MTAFEGLGLRAELVAALAAQGIVEPFPIQAATIPDALAGRDVCGRAKTGSGKTLAFGLPVLQRLARREGDGAGGRRERGLVLVPTRELAGQVVDVLRPLATELGLRVSAFYGGTPLEGQVKLAKKGFDLAVATPGRLIDLVERRAARLDDVAVLVVDEADRMADLGFLPQVEWLLRHMQRREQTLLFSATLDGDVDVLVRRHLRDPVRHEVAAADEKIEEMQHCFLAVHQMDRVKVLAAISGAVDRSIVFVRTKRGADRLVEQLRREGVHAGAMHGDLRQTARERSLAAFAAGRSAVLVATDVAARGIHVDDVDIVVHYDPPEDHKTYLHRSGRTARAGRQGIVATFVLWNQLNDVERLKKRLGLDEPIVEVFSNDTRLRDLSLLAQEPVRRAG